jgi:hypothetical protein
MSKFQLYIDNQKVDQFQDESVSLTETIQDIRDISKVFTDFTKSFNLPASDVNNKIFKHYYRFNLGHGYAFDARKKVSAKIELNTIPYRDGKIRLEGVDLENGKPKSYRVTFFGNTVNLKDVLGDDEINSLTWLSNFNTIYSEAKIKDILTRSEGLQVTVGSDTYDAALIVPLISNTVRLFYDSTIEVPYENADGSVNTELGGNLYPTNKNSETTNDVHGVYFEDLTYAIKLHLIVEAIQQQYEQIVFSDDFLDLTNGPDAYKNLYMLCQRKEGRPFEDMGVGEKLITGFPTTVNNYIAVNNEAVRIYNLNPNQLVTGAWTINTQQPYPTFTAVLKEGSEEIFRKEFAAGSNTTATINQILTNSSEGYTLTIETQTSFTIASLSFEGVTPTGNQLTSQINSQIDITNEKEFVVQNHLPNLKIIDFLTGLFKMFNLTAYEQDGIIHVKTLESFYSAGSVRDITEFVDPQTMQIDKALPYEEIEFKYKDTEAKIAKQHEQLSSNTWGAIKYQETGGLNSNETKFEVIAPFAHLKYERFPNTDIQWGWMANENGEPYFKDAVVFLSEYVTLPSTDYLRFLEGTSGVTSISDIQAYWMPSNTVERDPTVSKESIHFNLELSEWTNSSAFTETLFEQYYRFYIAGIFNSAKRLTKIKARLPKKFVINYTLADTLVINGDKYKINSITTNLLTGDSQLELLNDTVVDTGVTQTDTGGGGQPSNNPQTNVLTLYQCDSPNATYESTQTLATLNLANNTRVQDSSGNTYRVTGNAAPNQYTAISVTSTGLTGCPSTPTTPTTYYYGLTRCSDNATNFRTSTDVGNPTYAITQQVFDGSVKYIIRNSNTVSTVPSVTITSTPSPVQLTCAGNTTTNYYQLNPCCSGTTLYGFSASNSLSGTVVYQGQSYVISPTSTSGTIDIDSLSAGSCQTYYYTLNDCSNTSTIVHYANSNCSNLAGSELEYSGTCYYVATTTNTSGTIDLDNLSSCSCGGGPVTPPATEYYVLRDCDTATLVVTTTTTNDLTLTTSSTPSNASRVQDSSTSKCYTANGLTTDPSQYTTQIGQVSDLNILGCPSTPCTTVLYYHLQQCATGNTGYISGQTTNQITLNTNDMVASGSTSGPRYKVIGTTSSGSSVGTVYSVSDTDCPTYYELQQCYTLQGNYRTDQNINEITLNVGDRVADSCGQPYTVVTVGVQGGTYANVGTVTDLGASGCPSLTGPVYSLQRCSDSTTGYTSLQQASDVTIALNDTVTISGGDRYQVVGTTSSIVNQIGVVCPDGGNNCITPVIPPPPPPATINYARFISCDDPLGAVIAVYSYSQISTWWVISEVGQYECYRWLDTNQGLNPVELNSSNFNFFTEESTAGGNCLDCQAQSPPPPPPPPPPAQTCFTLTLYRATSAIGLCSATQRTVYTNGASLGASSAIYSTSDCSAYLTNDQYYSDDGGVTYYFWDYSALTLSGPFTNNCP